MGYGVGLVGLIAIKILAPAFYAKQDIKTPVRIAIVVLVLTQVFNLLLVPTFAHAGLALAIGLGALINAGWLLIGLLRRGSYQPQPGWLVLALQVLAASALLALFLLWGSSQFDWLHAEVVVWQRLLAMLGLMVGAALVYFGTLLLAGVKLKRLVRM